MSDTTRVLRAVYVDGETKSGKGAASQAIATALADAGHNVYYDVAGDFYRRYVALVRQALNVPEDESLPTGAVLEAAAMNVYQAGQVLEKDLVLGDLQRPAISNSVSVLGELPIAQKAGRDWWAQSLQRAHAAQADVIVFDARNPRHRVNEQLDTLGLRENFHIALDLYMTCAPREAAFRTLLGNGIMAPTAEQIDQECQNVINRRTRDRQRAETPFLVPEFTVKFQPDAMTSRQTLEQSWNAQADAELPLVVTVDNTNISKPAMIAAVSELAVESITFHI